MVTTHISERAEKEVHYDSSPKATTSAMCSFAKEKYKMLSPETFMLSRLSFHIRNLESIFMCPPCDMILQKRNTRCYLMKLYAV